MFQIDFSPHRDPRHDPVVEPLSPEQLEMLVLRLREHVQVKQIRVSEHFQDADPLRANSITASRFRQVSRVSVCYHSHLLLAHITYKLIIICL